MSNAYQTLGAALTVVCVYSRCRLALSLHSAANAVELEAEGDHNMQKAIHVASNQHLHWSLLDGMAKQTHIMTITLLSLHSLKSLDMSCNCCSAARLSHYKAR